MPPLQRRWGMDWDIPIAFFYGLAGVYLAYVGVQTVNPGERFLFLAIGAVFVALSVTQAFRSNQDKESSTDTTERY
jgi:hypothetical protein